MTSTNSTSHPHEISNNLDSFNGEKQLSEAYSSKYLPWIYAKESRFYAIPSSGNEDALNQQRRMANAWQRHSAFQKPLHISFLGMWMVWIVIAVGFFGLSAWFLQPLSIRMPVMIVVGILSLLQLVLTLGITMMDTRDGNVSKANVTRNLDFVKVAGVPVIDWNTNICGICRVKVGPKTRHCKSCNRCVSDFDHHCSYLNCCIGGRNYRLFFALLGLSLLILLFSAAWSLYCFFVTIVDPAGSQSIGRSEALSANTC
jgi:hypothetical protein